MHRATPLSFLLVVVAWLASGATLRAEPLRVAVMAFDNASGDPSHAALGVGLQAMLTTDLAGVQAFTLIERARLVEIQNELALNTTAAIDPATAAKVGKLAGASHLIAGALTVVGASMRLDARMFDVVTGKVVLTAKIEGEKDAFFELEKKLALQIVEATETKLSPKERAQIARIHTSDFQAFERFSAGISAFDHAAYDDAIAALREAAAMDDEFKLARLTLDDYQGIITKLQARADLLDASQRKAKALAANARAKAQQTIIDRFWEQSKTTGLPRLAALFQLSQVYGDIDGYTTNQIELRKIDDRFALERTADQLCATYFAEAVKAWPKVPLFVDADYGFNVPIEVDKFAEDEKRWLAEFFGDDGRTNEWQFHDKLLDNIEHHQRFAARLHLDVVEHARLLERAYQLGLKIDPDAVDTHSSGAPQSWRRGLTQTLGGLFRVAGLLDESTKYYAESGRFSHEPWAVKAAAGEVARNKEYAAFIAKNPSPRVLEWAIARNFNVDDDYQRDDIVKSLSQSPPGVLGRSALASGRTFRAGGDWRYAVVGDVPVFPIDDAVFQTGARTAGRRATSFNYYRREGKSADEEPMLAMVDARRGKALEASFTLVAEPADDWWYDGFSSRSADLAAAGFVAARPETVFLFGVEDVDVATFEDPDERNRQRLQRGLHAFGLKVDGSEVALVEVNEPEVRRGFSLARYRFEYKVLASASVTPGKALAVSLKVDGSKVSAKVGGRTLTATLSRAADGHAGFAFRKAGYMSVDDLKLSWR